MVRDLNTTCSGILQKGKVRIWSKFNQQTPLGERQPAATDGGVLLLFRSLDIVKMGIRGPLRSFENLFSRKWGLNLSRIDRR